MKQNRWTMLFAGMGLSVVIVVMAMLPSLDAQDRKGPVAKPAEEAGNPFAGKILMIVEKTESQGTRHIALEKGAITDLKGMRFLVGERVDAEGSPGAGLKTWVQTDTIGSITEFPNVEEYREYLKHAIQRFEEEFIVPGEMPEGVFRDPGIPGWGPRPLRPMDEADDDVEVPRPKKRRPRPIEDPDA